MKFICTFFFILVFNSLFSQTPQKNGTGNLGQGNSYGKSLDYNKKYDLAGRVLLNNPFGDSVVATSGRIILKITVDSSGNVIEVSGPAIGSTSTDSLLLQKAKNGAMKAKFSPSNLSNRQNGIMNFTFKKPV